MDVNLPIKVVSGLLAAFMLFAGTNKLLKPDFLAGVAKHLGYSLGFLQFVAVAEVAAGVGLAAAFFIPQLRFITALALVPLMLGAVVSHLRAGDPIAQALPAAVVLAVAAVVAWGSKG
jgi:hypothetical protein